MCYTIQAYEPCACSYTWGYDPQTGQSFEVRRPCLKHLEASSV